MKWIFTILVALNLIVFSSMIAQKMLLKNMPADNEAARTIVIQTPPPVTPPAHNTQTPPAVEKKTVRPRTERPRNTNTENVQNNPLPPIEPRLCGGASVTLKEDDYHRIKGLLADWPNAASRSVERNPNAARNQISSEFWVIVPAQKDSNEQIMSLMAKGFRPSQDNGLVVLGKFPARAAADALRQKVIAAGINANVMEKIRTGSSNQALSIATYNVAFLNINDADARKLNEILKPYAPLRRNPCKK